MCKSQTGVKTVKYFTKSLSHSSLPTLSTLCFLQKKKKKVSLPQTKPPASDPLPNATHHRPSIHSSVPFITDHRSTHRRHSSPIASPPPSAPFITDPIITDPLSFFFSFFFPLSSIVVGPTVSWPPPPSLIHFFNLSSGFFFSFIVVKLYRFGFLDGLWVMGGWVCGLWWMVGMFCGSWWWLSCGFWVGS